MFKRLFIFVILFLLFAVSAHATTTTVSIASANDDATYLKVVGTPTFTTDPTPLMYGDINLVGQYSIANWTDIRMALRFVISIPAGQEITTAYITFYAPTGGGALNSVKASIYAENSASPGSWSDLSNYTTRRANAVGAEVTWNDASFSPLDNYYNSPDIKTLIQPIADGGAISSLAFFIDPTAGCGDPADYVFTGYSTKEPQLTVVYKPKSAAKKQQIMMMW